MNMRDLMKMQQKVLKMQEDLEKAEYKGTAGGGAVEVTMTGNFEITGVKIDPEAFTPDDMEELEVMIKAAAKDAFDRSKEAQAKMMSSVTGGMKIPGMF